MQLRIVEHEEFARYAPDKSDNASKVENTFPPKEFDYESADQVCDRVTKRYTWGNIGSKIRRSVYSSTCLIPTCEGGRTQIAG